MYSNSRNGATSFFAIITQRGHKYATHSPAKQFYVFLATAPTDVLTAGTAEIQKKNYGKGVAHLWKNEGIAPLWELLYRGETTVDQENYWTKSIFQLGYCTYHGSETPRLPRLPRL